MATKKDKSAEASYESDLIQLQQLVGALEGGQLSLEESLKAYEEGIRLSRKLNATLDAMEQKMTQLISQPDGTLTETAFEVEE